MRKRHLLIIGAVVALLLTTLVLASCGTSTTTTTAGPVTTAGPSTTAGGAVDAAALYAANCAGCHKDLPGGSADDVKAAIQSGKGSMPGFADKLSPEEIAALATWVAAGGK